MFCSSLSSSFLVLNAFFIHSSLFPVPLQVVKFVILLCSPCPSLHSGLPLSIDQFSYQFTHLHVCSFLLQLINYLTSCSSLLLISHSDSISDLLLSSPSTFPPYFSHFLLSYFICCFPVPPLLPAVTLTDISTDLSRLGCLECDVGCDPDFFGVLALSPDLLLAAAPLLRLQIHLESAVCLVEPGCLQSKRRQITAKGFSHRDPNTGSDTHPS